MCRVVQVYVSCNFELLVFVFDFAFVFAFVFGVGTRGVALVACVTEAVVESFREPRTVLDCWVVCQTSHRQSLEARYVCSVASRDSCLYVLSSLSPYFGASASSGHH